MRYALFGQRQAALAPRPSSIKAFLVSSSVWYQVTRVLASSTWVLRQQTDGAPHDWQDINIMSPHSNSLVAITGMELCTVMDVNALISGYVMQCVPRHPGCHSLDDAAWESVQAWNRDVVCTAVDKKHVEDSVGWPT